MPKIKKYVLSSAGALLVATAAVGGFAWQKADNGDPRAPTVSVQRGNLIETAAASGKIEPDVQVEVVNATGVTGLAGQVAAALEVQGFPKVRTSSSDTRPTGVLVEYGAGDEEAARTVAAA